MGPEGCFRSQGLRAIPFRALAGRHSPGNERDSGGREKIVGEGRRGRERRRGMKMENSEANYSGHSNGTWEIKRFEGTGNKYFASFSRHPTLVLEGARKLRLSRKLFFLRKRCNASLLAGALSSRANARSSDVSPIRYCTSGFANMKI